MLTQELLKDLDYRQVLHNEFTYRKSKNSSYSLRSYARDLGLSPSRLSEVLNHKGHLSGQSLKEIGAKLGIPGDEVLALEAALNYQSAAAPETKLAAENYLTNYLYSNKYQQITEDTFKILADWYHFALLSAMELNFYDGSPEFLARVLRLELETVKDALKRMQDHRMVNFHDGKYYPTGEMFSTSQDIESRSLKQSHAQTMDQVKSCLSEVSVDLRDITSSTICIDVDRIPEAKKLIKEFRRNLSRFLESGKKTAVYNINIQLHPLSEIVNE